MPFGLGFFATAGAGVSAGSFDLLETQVLGSSAASVTFSSLSTYASTYKHLQVRMVARTTKTGDPDNYLQAQFNNITTASYASHFLWGNGSTVSSNNSTSATSMRLGQGSLVGNSATTGAFSAYVIDILDPFDSSKNTTARSLGGVHGGVTYSYIMGLNSGVFLSTAALTEIDLFPLYDSFSQYSRFSLYGVKGS